MRLIITGLAMALLAGCNDLVTINEVGGGGAGPMPGNTAAPGAPGTPGAPGAPGAPGRPSGPRNSRAVMIADCTEDLGRNLPRGTDIAALCTCSVDRMLARVPQRDAVSQCAAALRITLPGGQ